MGLISIFTAVINTVNATNQLMNTASDTADKVYRTTGDIHTFLASLLPHTRYDVFFEQLSRELDVMILQTMAKEDLKYAAGKCILSLSADERLLSVETNLYYLQKNGKYTRKDSVGTFLFSRLTEDAQQRIVNQMEDRKMEIDVEKP